MNTPTAIAATQTKLTTTIRLMSLRLETSVVMSAWKIVATATFGTDGPAVPISAADSLQLFVGKLVALLFRQPQDILGGLAGPRLIHLLGGQVLELYCWPPWSDLYLCIFYV